MGKYHLLSEGGRQKRLAKNALKIVEESKEIREKKALTKTIENKLVGKECFEHDGIKECYLGKEHI